MKMSIAFMVALILALLLFQRFIGINFPIVRVAFGICLMVLGFQIVTGSFNFSITKNDSDYQAVFGTKVLHYPTAGNQSAYYTVLADSELNLARVDTSRGDVSFTIYTIFGQSRIGVDLSTPLLVNSRTSIVGTIKGPDGRPVGAGPSPFKSKKVAARPTKLILNFVSIFSSVELQNLER